MKPVGNDRSSRDGQKILKRAVLGQNGLMSSKITRETQRSKTKLGGGVGARR